MNRVLHGCGKGKSLKLWLFKQRSFVPRATIHHQVCVCDGNIPLAKGSRCHPEKQDANGPFTFITNCHLVFFFSPACHKGSKEEIKAGAKKRSYFMMPTAAAISPRKIK